MIKILWNFHQRCILLLKFDSKIFFFEKSWRHHFFGQNQLLPIFADVIKKFEKFLFQNLHIVNIYYVARFHYHLTNTFWDIQVLRFMTSSIMTLKSTYPRISQNRAKINFFNSDFWILHPNTLLLMYTLSCLRPPVFCALLMAFWDMP